MGPLTIAELKALSNLLGRAINNEQLHLEVEVEDGVRNGISGSSMCEISTGDLDGEEYISICIDLEDAIGLIKR
jgi:hypothetical protein